MPNGKQHKINPKTGLKYPPRRLTNLHKAERLEEGLVTARLKADLRFKKSKKGLEKSFREHLDKWIDNINPLELVAIGGLTYIIYDIIDKTENLKLALPVKGFVAATPLAYYLREAVGFDVTQFFKEKVEVQITPDIPDIPQLIVSFTLAYIIIRHGGQLLGLMKEGVGNLGTVIGALMGVTL